MPARIRGLQKSCLVIPCSFTYSSYPPTNPDRIVWYQYVNHRYPLVYDSWYPTSVIDKYRGKTSLFKKTYRDCSLLIKDLSLSHSQDRLYTWVDPEHIGKNTYRFYDVTTLIHVDCKCYNYLPSTSYLVHSFTIQLTVKQSFLCENGVFICYWSFATVNI